MLEFLRSWQPIEIAVRLERQLLSVGEVHSETFTGRCSEGVALKAKNPP